MEFCCLKFIFSQVEDPNFENFLGSMPPDLPKWSKTHGRTSSWSGKVGEFHVLWKVATLLKSNKGIIMSYRRLEMF